MALQIIRRGLGVDGNSTLSGIDITILDVRRGSIIIEYVISALNDSLIGMASTNMDESLGSSIVIGNLSFNFSSNSVLTAAPTGDPTVNPTIDPTTAGIVEEAESEAGTSRSGIAVILEEHWEMVMIAVAVLVLVAVLLLFVRGLQRGQCCHCLRSEERAWNFVLAGSPMSRRSSKTGASPPRQMSFRNVDGNRTYMD